MWGYNMGSITNFFNLWGDQHTQRAEATNPAYQCLSKCRSIINAPFTACSTISGKIAERTLAAGAYLCPTFVRKRYDSYCHGQANRCLDKVTPVLQKVPGLTPLLQNATEEPSGLWGMAATAISWAKPVMSWFKPETEAHLSTAEDLLRGQNKKVIAEKVISPAIQSAHQLAAKEVIGFAYSMTLQYYAYKALNMVASGLVTTQANLDYTLLAGQIGLLTYMYGPTVYKCCKAAKGLYDSRYAANEMKKYLESTSAKEAAHHLAQAIPGATGEMILQIAAVILSEAKIEFFLPFVDHPEEFLSQIASSISGLTHSST
jgi:hypothetical protein